MRNIAVVLFGAGAALLSCASQSGGGGVSAEQLRFAVPELAGEAAGNAIGEEGGGLVRAAEAVFDPKNPPFAVYTETKRDIQLFVEQADVLIREKKYAEWEKLLSPDYVMLINSPAFLDEVSQQPRLKSQNIVLRTGRDYFLNVVVTSRSNMRANDIEFITLSRVMAFTVNQAGQRMRIYTLDKTGDSWEIVN
ncbi:MAG: hypothetical protein LBL31_00625 [Spirochaetaceae bacterium]|jgi:hypothetical protein|nr:hypothetical protein [Spirochaetaceae bacterium]